jgi:holo-[acyl-carrier protein] synthase
MPIPIAHGVDVVSVPRIAEMLREHGDRFLDRCFTGDEQQYALSQKKRTAEHLAARFAAKEAVMKALGTGLRDGLSWTQIEVYREPSGRPMLALTARAAEMARERSITGWLLSLSHTDEIAFASVIGTGNQ